MATGSTGSTRGAARAWSFFESLPRQYLLVAAGASIALALVLAVVAMTRGPAAQQAGMVPLLGGHPMTPVERNAAVAAFQEATLTDYEYDGVVLLVPRKKHNEYVAAMAAKNSLPGNFRAAYDRFIESDSWPNSKSKSDRLFHVAKQDSLAKIIASFPEIENASVEVSDYPPTLRRKDTRTASVKVSTVDGKPLTPVRVDQIEQLVSHAFSDLPKKSVAVVGDALPGGGGAGGDGIDTSLVEIENRYLQYKESYKKSVENNIYKILSHIEGATVAVNVEIDPHHDINIMEKNVGKGAITESDTETESEDKMSEVRQGQPGVPPNVDIPPPNTGATALGPFRDTRELDKAYQDFENDQKVVQKQMANFIPTNVGVVIKVPDKYLAPPLGIRDPNDPQTPLINIQEVQNSIVGLKLPGLTDPATVQVVGYRMKEPVVPAYGIAEFWKDYGNQVAFGLVALIAVAAALAIGLRSPIPDAARRAVEEAIAGIQLVPEEEELPPMGIRRRFEQIQKAITDSISKDPATAASLMHRWIMGGRE